MKKVLVLTLSLLIYLNIHAGTQTFSDYYSGNYRNAFIQLKKLAEKGDSDAQNSLGLLYETGLGVEKDYKQAFYWYNESLKNANMLAAVNLGNFFV